MLLGCIADDFTGATDLANNLVRGGMRAVQTIGVPRDVLAEPAEAVVVALKSRTVPADEAVRQSLAALAWLRREGCRQVLRRARRSCGRLRRVQCDTKTQSRPAIRERPHCS